MAARTTAPTTSGGSTLRAASLGGTRRDLGLDLARAYVDMGDPQGARDILDEVVKDGDEGQRLEARELLSRLV